MDIGLVLQLIYIFIDIEHDANIILVDCDEKSKCYLN